MTVEMVPRNQKIRYTLLRELLWRFPFLCWLLSILLQNNRRMIGASDNGSNNDLVDPTFQLLAGSQLHAPMNLKLP